MASDIEKSLTFKQRAFAKEYVRNGGNATQAYEKIYQVKTSKKNAATNACDIKSNAKVSRYIEELNQNLFFRLGLDDESLYQYAADILQYARDAEKVKDRTSALDQVCKMTGLYTKVDAQTEHKQPIILEVLDNRRVNHDKE